MATFTPHPIKGKRFVRQTVNLDGFRFENCEFEDCTLVYSGGPADCSACMFHPDTQWQFQGQAAMMMQVLPLFGWRFSFGTGRPEDVIRFPSDAT
jgi:hypothetical protein